MAHSFTYASFILTLTKGLLYARDHLHPIHYLGRERSERGWPLPAAPRLAQSPRWPGTAGAGSLCTGELLGFSGSEMFQSGRGAPPDVCPHVPPPQHLYSPV